LLASTIVTGECGGWRNSAGKRNHGSRGQQRPVHVVEVKPIETGKSVWNGFAVSGQAIEGNVSAKANELTANWHAASRTVFLGARRISAPLSYGYCYR